MSYDVIKNKSDSSKPAFSVDADDNRDTRCYQMKTPFWCNVCSLDLQSPASLAEHMLGRKHVKKEFWQQLHSTTLSGTTICPKRLPFPAKREEQLGLDELFQNLALGKYRNVVILTGAGVSTAAGIPDFRSPGGIFDTIRKVFGDRYPKVHENPEHMLTRSFATEHPDDAKKICSKILDPARKAMKDKMPTTTHKFCAWLYRQGMLRRVYTQNIDGLHLHPSLGLPPDIVVESHGSLVESSSSLVLYGDPLPQRFYDCCDIDFSLKDNFPSSDRVDLLMVFGTSLQVAPICGLPNMTPRGSARVLINRDLDDCLTNSFSKQQPEHRGTFETGYEGSQRTITNCRIGSRKNVPLRSLWSNREGNKKWRQLLVEDDSDAFVKQFFESDAAINAGCRIDL